MRRRRFITPILAGAAMTLGATTTAHADLGDQIAKLLPNDGAEVDNFGRSVAISGPPGNEVAIVGAWLDDDNGSDSGSAYLFSVTTGRQIAKLLPVDGAAGDEFGTSVSISGTIAIVGAPYDADNGDDSGSAYLFDITTDQQVSKLLPGDGAAGDRFGLRVAIDGAIAIVGSHNDDDNGIESGSAYLFDTTTGQQIAKLLPDDGAENDFFGLNVAIEGTTALIGALGDDDNGSNSGSAYLFDISDPKSPVQTAKLLADDGAESENFGRSVAISGGIAIIGAHQDNDNGDNSGSAYLFDIATGEQIAKLRADDGAEGDFFGLDVGISGATAIVGSGSDDDNGGESGSAYLFDITTGQQIAKLVPSDSAEGDKFGDSVSISNTIVIVGAPQDDDNGDASGSVYLFDATPCPWDLNDDGRVGTSDLLVLLGFWGTDPGGPPDFDGDGNVGATDLIELLGNWGPCE